MKRQEHELLEAHSLPLRNYLMKYVMPSLSEAMLEGCKVRPEDPVDFLVTYSVFYTVDPRNRTNSVNQYGSSLTHCCVLCLQAEHLLQNNQED